MNTVESPVHRYTKNASIEKNVHDTVYTDRVDGLPCRVMKSQGAQRLIKDRIPLIRALFTSRDAAKAFGFPWFKMVLGILAAGWQNSIMLARMANAFHPIQLSLTEGNWQDGVIPLGQITGIIHDTPTVKELIDRLIAEATAAHHSAALKLEG